MSHRRQHKEVPIVEAHEAASLIPDGAVVSVSSSSGLACPDALLEAIGDSFRGTGRPSGLTSIHPIAAGDMFGIKGIDHIALDGLLTSVIAGSYPSGPSSMTPPAIRTMIDENRIQAWNLPSGVIFQMHAAGTARQPGVLTKVGIGTFVDPRIQGGALNEATPTDLVGVLTVDGEEWLNYPPLRPDVALIRGTTADSHGNITTEHEGSPLGILEQAFAARSNGGIVIAQVKRIAKAGSLPAQNVQVPGAIVDAVVVVPDQMQATETLYDPALSGEIVAPDGMFEPLPFGLEKVLARRAALELKPGWIVNLGFGVCAGIPRIFLEENKDGLVTWLTEQGAVGGIPLTGSAFGCARNPAAVIASPDQFKFLQSAGFDAACLSFIQVDQHCNVNVSLLPGKSHVSAGIGGFADITSAASKIVFAGTFTAGKSSIEAGCGQLRIEANGPISKIVPEVDQISFSGSRALQRGQNVIFVTERCVLELRAEGLVVTEIAPGADLVRDITDLVEFPLHIAENLRPMDSALFKDAPLGPNFGSIQ
ncbi:acyl CoA:acetate/3-ketoacid CoA transferase [Candidatus Poriferisodalis sp.]|uniref:acyl CoA:acetate/3-ketoacid CoA transferase n=1 Tax=Candidatus Poriferisodalis sp. TaxID=3101277 RepID=UPI003B021231